MKPNQFDSKVLSIIKEGDEYSPIRSKGNKFSVKQIKSYVQRKTQEITPDCSPYELSLLTRSPCEIIQEYWNNPFARAKLTYLLNSHKAPLRTPPLPSPHLQKHLSQGNNSTLKQANKSFNSQLVQKLYEVSLLIDNNRS